MTLCETRAKKCRSVLRACMCASKLFPPSSVIFLPLVPTSTLSAAGTRTRRGRTPRWNDAEWSEARRQAAMEILHFAARQQVGWCRRAKFGHFGAEGWRRRFLLRILSTLRTRKARAKGVRMKLSGGQLSQGRPPLNGLQGIRSAVTYAMVPTER